MADKDHVTALWLALAPRQQRRDRIPHDIRRQLARFDRATLAEAADLLVRTTGRLDPNRWLAKATLGATLSPGRAAPQRRLPEAFDPFALDAPAHQ